MDIVKVSEICKTSVYLTENYGLLENLLPGDLVVADRGFTVQESAGIYCAEVNIPPFTCGKKNSVNAILISHNSCLVLGFMLKE